MSEKNEDQNNEDPSVQEIRVDSNEATAVETESVNEEEKAMEDAVIEQMENEMKKTKEEAAEESKDTSEENGSSEVSAEETQTELSAEEQQQQAMEKMSAELDELKNQYLRKQADFENFRKRMFREKEEAIKYANSNLLLDLVTIIDDFERAIKSSEESKDFDTFYSGIELIEKQFTGMLEKKYGLKRFNSAGEAFDPEKHEALMMEETSDFEPETVIEDFQKGYMLHDRVLRHSKVKVSRAPAGQDDEA
jgi:molecular chaperone GrpE